MMAVNQPAEVATPHLATICEHLKSNPLVIDNGNNVFSERIHGSQYCIRLELCQCSENKTHSRLDPDAQRLITGTAERLAAG